MGKGDLVEDEAPESRVQGKNTENDAGSSSSAQDLVFNHS